MKRRYENLGPAVEVAIDVVVGTIIMLVAHFAFGLDWFWAILIGYGATTALVYALCHDFEMSEGSSGRSGSSWWDDIL